MDERQELESLMLRQEVKNLIQQASHRTNTIAFPNGQLIALLVLKEHIVNFIFWNTFLDMIESEIKRLGYAFKICIMDDNNDEWKQSDICGYILLGRIPPFYLSQVEMLKKPIVFIDGEAEFGSYGQVRVNNKWGTYMLAKTAIEMGHRNIVFCGIFSYRSYKEREEGTRHCARDHIAQGVVYEFLDLTNQNPSERKQSLVELLTRRNPPTFIQCSSDSEAQTVYSVAESLMLKIPNDLSVVGFDNIKESHQMTPPLTTVDVLRMDVAVAAVELLIKMTNAPLAPNETILLEPTVVMRGSLAPPGDKQ